MWLFNVTILLKNIYTREKIISPTNQNEMVSSDLFGIIQKFYLTITFLMLPSLIFIRFTPFCGALSIVPVAE